ncbi:MAG TPA: hypothetical protein VHW01_18515 [Polyangiaceae bacterium]|jgi:hypothetical protein|nr:hypothetical protein [Polyangiaceae bacterium]
MKGKLLCGYQGWFRTPGDEDNTGWQHYIADWGTPISPAKITVDYWPEMTELGASESYKADGFSNPDNSQATLFSSDNARTVLRHFQWMEAYGIDGIAVQRFMPGATPDAASLRVIKDIGAAANLTGRTYFIEYDMSGFDMSNGKDVDLVPTITKDWHYLVDAMKLTSDARYLQQGGMPVIGIFGFYEDRFSAATANAILDVFKGPGPYQAFVAGAGAWYWNVQNYSDAWKTMMYRMGSYQPWNTGNSGGKVGDVPVTNYWATDKAALAAHNVMYVPQIYPGSSALNRDRKPWGPATEDRASGSFLWSQLTTAVNLNADSVFLGMFDEMDEGTQLIKVSQTPPTAANFRDYQGLPSDAYLCFAGQGTKMFHKEMPFSAIKPDCAKLTQPSIPDPIAPLTGAKQPPPTVTYSFSKAIALAQGGTIDHYEVAIDSAISSTNALSVALPTASGSHVWRVRAVNSLNNAGGWSIPQSFTVTPCTTDCSTGTGGATGTSGASGIAGSPTSGAASAGGGASGQAVGGSGSSSAGSSPSNAGSGVANGPNGSGNGSKAAGCGCRLHQPRGGSNVDRWLTLGALAGVVIARRRRARSVS